LIDILDKEVPIAKVFYYENPLGDLQTTMSFYDYVITIGNKVSSLVGQINTINSILDQHDTRITDLENTPIPEFELPLLTPSCLFEEATEMDVLLEELEKQFCELQTAIGKPKAIILAMNSACAGLNDADRLSGLGKMKNIEGWHESPVSLSQSFSNMWKTVCDMRNAVVFMRANCCDSGCDDINIEISGEMISSDVMELTFTGTLPSNFTDGTTGSSIILVSSIGEGPQIINNIPLAAAHLNNPSNPLEINLSGINGANDINVQLTHKFKDNILGTVCQGIISMSVLGTETCPDLTLMPSYESLDYSFAWSGATPKLMTIEIYDALTDTLITSNLLTVNSGSPSGTINGLLQTTDYKVRLIINGTPCDFETFSTLSYPCNLPIMLAPDIDYSDPEGDVTGLSYSAWQLEYDSYHP
jgi:hypothetical protein